MTATRKLTPALLLILLWIILLSFTACKEEETVMPVQETGTVTDIDGNEYKAVKIGDQWWMAENLEVTKFRDSSFVIDLQDDLAAWSVDTSGAFCRFDDNDNSPGLLYNWYAVKKINGLAPKGWHVATDDDWKQLERFAGMSQNECDKTGWRGLHEADKLKKESPGGWSEYENVWANNESGFTALGGSCRLPNAVFGNPGLKSTGFWWTSTEHSSGEGIYRYMDYKNSNVFRSHENSNSGYSVRCVKD